MIELQALNGLTDSSFVEALAGIFEHSPWVAQRTAARRPFPSLLALHREMSGQVMQAGEDLQLALIRSHPQLAGRAAQRGELTAASSGEQARAGLSACTATELAQLQSLNAEYLERFGFPFIIAVKGHTPDSVIAAGRQRLSRGGPAERSEALREIFRIAFFRLADLVQEPAGGAILAMAEDLANFSDQEGALTCAYLTAAHLATAQRIRDFMMAAGLAVHVDAVGNVVGVLEGASARKRVLTGSHYDTVVDAGRYDGRLGILLPIAVAGALRRAGTRLPYTLEIIAFAEEEGVRFKSTFLGSRAIAGSFDRAVLDSVDAQGIRMSDALRAAGRDVAAIAEIARDRGQIACFIEVHIEQGPVLLTADLPVGVVSAIAGSIRSLVTVRGSSGHAGTVPMNQRQDAAAAAAEMVLAVERRCRGQAGLVGTVGRLEVVGGAVNVIPGRCEFSIDIRAAQDSLRDAAAVDIGASLEAIATRRGVRVEQRRILQAGSVVCSPALQAAWAASIERVTGRAALCLPSGAGHDAMMMAGLTDIGMLFVRCGNGGISHHPDESLSADDAKIAAQVFQDFLLHYQVPA